MFTRQNYWTSYTAGAPSQSKITKHPFHLLQEVTHHREQDIQLPPSWIRRLWKQSARARRWGRGQSRKTRWRKVEKHDKGEKSRKSRKSGKNRKNRKNRENRKVENRKSRKSRKTRWRGRDYGPRGKEDRLRNNHVHAISRWHPTYPIPGSVLLPNVVV